jgi:hypothetical protein
MGCPSKVCRRRRLWLAIVRLRAAASPVPACLTSPIIGRLGPLWGAHGRKPENGAQATAAGRGTCYALLAHGCLQPSRVPAPALAPQLNKGRGHHLPAPRCGRQSRFQQHHATKNTTTTAKAIRIANVSGVASNSMGRSFRAQWGGCQLARTWPYSVRPPRLCTTEPGPQRTSQATAGRGTWRGAKWRSLRRSLSRYVGNPMQSPSLRRARGLRAPRLPPQSCKQEWQPWSRASPFP